MLKKKLIPTPLWMPQVDPRPPLRPIRTGRVALVAWLLFRVVWHLWRMQLRAPRGAGGTYTPKNLAVMVRVEFERLGGLWIKAAQILAMQRGGFAREFCDELSQIHDGAIGIPGDVATRIIEEELRCPLKAVFREFDVVPIAATAIGQVHVAWLRENDVKVAIKVQRPAIEAAFSRDLVILSACSIFFRLFYSSWSARLGEMYSTLERTVATELDYRMEASAIRRARRSITTDKVYTPKVFSRRCSKRVLVMEFVDGVPASDYAHALVDEPQKAKKWRKENGVDPKKLGRRLDRGDLKELLTGHRSRGDLHPGDIMILRNNRIALIGFGSLSVLDKGLLARGAAPRRA